MDKFRENIDKTPQQNGRLFERYWANLFGVEPIRGSGNQWTSKMDVIDGAILWSLKHTQHDSFRVTKELMREVERAINGPGGIGGNTIPGIAVSLSGEPFVTLRAEDFLRLLEGDASKYLAPSKGEAKRSRSKVPQIMREDDK